MSEQSKPPVLSIDDLIFLAGIYFPAMQKGDPNGWSNEETNNLQGLNFRRMLEVGKITGHSIERATCLDVGCGTGDFCRLWQESGGGQYSGIDPLDSQLRIARAQNPRGKFIPGEYSNTYTQDGALEKFDFTFASGTFNILTHLDQRAYLKQMLSLMMRQARKAAVFNLVIQNGNLDFSNTPFQAFPSELVHETMLSLAPPDKIATVSDNVNGTEYMHGYMWK